MKSVMSEFDRELDRGRTHDLKWRKEGVDAYLGQAVRDDMIPMWIADTDFRCMKEVTEADLWLLFTWR